MAVHDSMLGKTVVPLCPECKVPMEISTFVASGRAGGDIEIWKCAKHGLFKSDGTVPPARGVFR